LDAVRLQNKRCEFDSRRACQPDRINMVLEAEVVEVPDCESGSNGFKSHLSPQNMKNCSNTDCVQVNPQSYDNFYSRQRIGKKKISTYYSANCRKCHNAKGSRTYKGRDKRRMLVREGKQRPCADCGVQYPYYVMDYDHSRGTKLFTITTKWMSRSLEALVAEIAKCDVVCSNCHRQRTHNRLSLN
jgi:hypothetical protein